MARRVSISVYSLVETKVSEPEPLFSPSEKVSKTPLKTLNPNLKGLGFGGSRGLRGFKFRAFGFRVDLPPRTGLDLKKPVTVGWLSERGSLAGSRRVEVYTVPQRAHDFRVYGLGFLTPVS